MLKKLLWPLYIKYFTHNKIAVEHPEHLCNFAHKTAAGGWYKILTEFNAFSVVSVALLAASLLISIFFSFILIGVCIFRGGEYAAKINNFHPHSIWHLITTTFSTLISFVIIHLHYPDLWKLIVFGILFFIIVIVLGIILFYSILGVFWLVENYIFNNQWLKDKTCIPINPPDGEDVKNG